MTWFHSNIEWATGPPEFGPGTIKANAVIYGSIALAVAGLIWLAWG